MNLKDQNFGKGRLTDRLLATGLLSPEVLSQLQKEWQRKVS